MHAMDLGVMRQLASLWLDAKPSTGNVKKPWYIGSNILKVKMDERLTKIRPPSNITRLRRSLSQRVHWKAEEWRNFMLYYAPLVLRNILPNHYYKYFLKLSEAVFILNQQQISQMQLYKSRKKN